MNLNWTSFSIFELVFFFFFFLVFSFSEHSRVNSVGFRNFLLPELNSRTSSSLNFSTLISTVRAWAESKILQSPLDFHLFLPTPPPPAPFFYPFSRPVCLFYFLLSISLHSGGGKGLRNAVRTLKIRYKDWNEVQVGTGTRFSLEFLGQLFMVLRICRISPACLYRPYPGMVIFKDLFPLYQLDQGNDKEMNK